MKPDDNLDKTDTQNRMIDIQGYKIGSQDLKTESQYHSLYIQETLGNTRVMDLIPNSCTNWHFLYKLSVCSLISAEIYQLNRH